MQRREWQGGRREIAGKTNAKEVSIAILAAQTGWSSGLLNPFALLCNVSVMMLGGAWRHICSDEDGRGDRRSRRRAGIATSLLTLILFAAAGLCVYAWIDGYALAQPIDHAGPSNPMRKTVETAAGVWFANYHAQPWTAAARRSSD